jgi:uncharacterized protein YlzI (FlbEa/FlbD family)
MILEFTNGVENNEGLKLAINTEKVLSVFQTYKDEEKTEQITCIFADGNTWHVKETFEEVVNKLNDNS